MRILVSAHDAGGANLLLHKYRDHPDTQFVLTGPAAILAKTLQIEFKSSIDFSQIKNFHEIVVSSNSSEQLADRILNFGLECKMKTTGVLDHWVNYKTRWSKIPGTIEVQDFRAFIGSFVLFGFRTKLRNNYYLDYLRKNFTADPSSSETLLVILQPISGSYLHNDTNSCFCNILIKLNRSQRKIKKLILREHASTPSDECANFLRLQTSWIVSKSDLSRPLHEDLSNCGVVLGLDSYALFVSRKLGLKVMSINRRRRSWFAPKYDIVH